MTDARSQIRALAAVSCALAGLLVASPAYAAAKRLHAAKVHVVSISGLEAFGAGSSAANAPPHGPMNKTLRHTTSSQVPTISGTPVSNSTGGASGWAGLDDVQQLSAGTGIYANSQGDLAPPDQGLCAGQGDVLEVINEALEVYTTSGTPLTSPIALSQFVGAPPATTNGGPPFGAFITDPRCYYDPDTQHWFMSFLDIGIVPATGAFGTTSSEYIAVSQTSDPTGTWNVYSFPSTDDGTDGTPSDPGCPCYGDQPLLGADANGVYIATNEFSIAGPNFNGAQIYAMSKTGLETGSNTAVTLLQPATSSAVTNTIGGMPYSVEPTTTPDASYDTSAGGTEYFQSSLDFAPGTSLGTRANRIAVWSLTNTSSLNTTSPAPVLHVAVVPSEEYAQPANATQKSGPLLLNKHLPLIDTNDDRMLTAVYAAGQIWSGLNTAVKTPQGPTLTGAAWFATTPATDSTGALSASMAGQGYVGVNQEDVIYPSIGVTPAGKAVIAFTLTGPDYYPSAAWAPLSLSGVGPTIYVTAPGAAPSDDFTSLKAYQGTGSGRWGDYSAAFSDTSGNIWMGDEYISGVERTPFANWATFLSEVTP